MFCFSLVIFWCILCPHNTLSLTLYSTCCLYSSCFNSPTLTLFPLCSNLSCFCFVLSHSYFVNNQSTRCADGLSILLLHAPFPPLINVYAFYPMLAPFAAYCMLSLLLLMPSPSFKLLNCFCTHSVPMSPSTPPCTDSPCVC
jgi:hypothetical protein